MPVSLRDFVSDLIASARACGNAVWLSLNLLASSQNLVIFIGGSVGRFVNATAVMKSAVGVGCFFPVVPGMLMLLSLLRFTELSVFVHCSFLCGSSGSLGCLKITGVRVILNLFGHFVSMRAC